MSNSSDISDKIVGKLNEIVEDKTELEMILDLLKIEQRYTHGSKPLPQAIKREFQLLLDQHFPLQAEEKQ